MRDTNAIEAKDGLSCTTCEYAEFCTACKKAVDATKSICENYCNEVRGYFWDAVRARRVKK